ncbi:3536_t:CDS:1, partial [Funneliformis caledonium]
MNTENMYEELLEHIQEEELEEEELSRILTLLIRLLELLQLGKKMAEETLCTL